MIRIHAMGLVTELMDQIDIIEMLRKVLPESTMIKVIDDLEHHFGTNSREYCWTFGVDCADEIQMWIDQMQKDGYTFEGATLFVDNGGFVAGIWPGKEVSSPEQKDKEEVEENEDNEVEATSPLEISAKVKLICTDEEGKIKRFTVKGKYKRRREQNYFGLIDVIDIDKETGLDKESLQALLEWTNECNVNLLDYTIEGPAYAANQSHVHNFSISRIVLDNLHAAVLDEMLKKLRITREKIVLPQSHTEMKIAGK